MTRMIQAALLGMTTALLVTGAAWADTTVHVSLVGEDADQMMSVKLDASTIKAGPVTFDVTNDAATAMHEMVLVPVKAPGAPLPLTKAKHRVNERGLHSLGEVSDLQPGQHGTLKVRLKPGASEVFCNIKGHYEAGMVASLTVTP